jgi:hypothetical protein
MRGIARVFKIRRNTLTQWLKQKGALARPEHDACGATTPRQPGTG